MREVTVRMNMKKEGVEFIVSGDEDDILHKTVIAALALFRDGLEKWEKANDAGSSGNN